MPNGQSCFGWVPGSPAGHGPRRAGHSPRRAGRGPAALGAAPPRGARPRRAGRGPAVVSALSRVTRVPRATSALHPQATRPSGVGGTQSSWIVTALIGEVLIHDPRGGGRWRGRRGGRASGGGGGIR